MSRLRPTWLLVGLLGTLTGCAGSGSLLPQRTTVGSLKTSLSHLEYENQQLRREVASIKEEYRQVENRLVQEESLNGDLAARLDDARTLLARRGLDAGSEPSSDGLEPAGGPARQTLSAARSNRKRRKPPFAQIPGRVNILPPSDGDESGPSNGWGKPAAPSDGDPGPTSQIDRSPLWLPVARGATEPSPPRRR